MQIVSNEVKNLLARYAKITLTPYLQGVKVSAGLGSFSYESACGNEQAFSFGNSCAASIEFVLAASIPGIEGQNIDISWAVDETEYPLFSGQVKTAAVSGGRTTIKAWNAMYFSGSKVFTPAAALLADVDAAEAFSFLAAAMGVEAEPDTLEALSGIIVSRGFSDLPEDATNSAVAGHIAALIGGNAWINRSGQLAVCRYAQTDFESEPYTGGASAENSDFLITGVTLQREIRHSKINADGSASDGSLTHEFAAGDGTLMVSNPLADQEAADRAMAVLEPLSFRPGIYSFPGGVLLDPGDIIEIHSMDGSYSVLSAVIRMSFDGGIRTTVSCGGYPESGGAAGQINQALKALELDLLRVKKLVAENASIVSAKITNLTTEDITAGRIHSTDFATVDLQKLYPATNLYPSDLIYPNNGEQIIRGFEIDFHTGIIRGVFWSEAVDLLTSRMDSLEERVKALETGFPYPVSETAVQQVSEQEEA